MGSIIAGRPAGRFGFLSEDTSAASRERRQRHERASDGKSEMTFCPSSPPFPRDNNPPSPNSILRSDKIRN